MRGRRTKCRRLGDLIEEISFFVPVLEEVGFSLLDVLDSLGEDADSFKQMI
jgi:hypothetical protein